MLYVSILMLNLERILNEYCLMRAMTGLNRQAFN
jgi:hypothetical protein